MSAVRCRPLAAAIFATGVGFVGSAANISVSGSGVEPGIGGGTTASGKFFEAAFNTATDPTGALLSVLPAGFVSGDMFSVFLDPTGMATITGNYSLAGDA